MDGRGGLRQPITRPILKAAGRWGLPARWVLLAQVNPRAHVHLQAAAAPKYQAIGGPPEFVAAPRP